MKPLEESKILITGVARNCASTLALDLERISLALNGAKELSILVIESDSNDNSEYILKSLKEKKSNFDYISLGTLSVNLPQRTARIAYCRNKYVEEIINNSKYNEIDYVAVVDLDGINSEINTESIASCWRYDNWYAMTANQRGPYYDVWALRHDLWSPNDCWEQNAFYNLLNKNYYENLATTVHSRMLEIPENLQPISVNSAFGGFSIYEKSIFKSCSYKGLTESGSEICEHVYFNYCIKNLGLNIYINPKLINAAYTEHTSHLKNDSPNFLTNSKFGKIIINKNDKYIGRHIIEKGYWAEDDINVIIKLLEIQLQKKDFLTFYDIGANVGTHSLAIAKSFKKNVKIRAFEAQRMIYNMLCGTVALNGNLNIYCHNFAVSDINGDSIEIKIPDYYSINNFGGLELIPPLLSDNHDLITSELEYISTITIDSFNEHIDFLKMDIEGMEDKAIRGAVNSISKSRPICFIEVHKTDHNFIFNFFKNIEYTGYKKGMDLIAIPNELNIDINGLDKHF